MKDFDREGLRGRLRKMGFAKVGGRETRTSDSTCDPMPGLTDGTVLSATAWTAAARMA